jgi:hypothetical protein
MKTLYGILLIWYTHSRPVHGVPVNYTPLRSNYEIFIL